MKEVNLLSKGLFNNKLLDSRVKTRAVTRKEKILGHLVGPLGLIFIVNTIAALVEKFFMQQVGLVYPGGADGAANPLAQAMGDKYQLVVMIARFLMVGMGLVNGWLISHTKSKQGRLRPWFLIFSFMLVIIGVLIFLPRLDRFAYHPRSQGEGADLVYTQDVLDAHLRHNHRTYRADSAYSVLAARPYRGVCHTFDSSLRMRRAAHFDGILLH